MPSIPKILITILLVSAVVVGVNLSLTDLQNHYNEFTVSTELQSNLDTFNQSLTNIQNKSLDIQNRTSGTQASQDVDIGLNLQASIGALKLAYDSFGIVNNMIETISVQLKINTLWTWVLLGILIITITFILIQAFVKNPL